MLSAADIKKVLRAEGFEIYRTRGDVIHLAERVRENLLMDACVFVRAGGPAVGLITRAERAVFPGETHEQLALRARALAEGAAQAGYQEISSRERDIPDPGDPTRILDVWSEVTFEKPLAHATDAAPILDEIRFALSIPKAASHR